MDIDEIPEECMNDPEFRAILASALCAEVTAAEKTLSDIEGEITESKKQFFTAFENRKRSKQQLKYLKEQNAVLKPTLERLQYDRSEQMKETNLLKGRLDDASLRAEALKVQQQHSLKEIKETWTSYEEEYEKLPLAVERQKARNEVKQLEVQLMLKKYKKIEHMKMLMKREEIYKAQIQSACIEFSKMVLDIWKAQDHRKELLCTAKTLKDKYEALSQQTEKLQKQIEDEAKAKALARKQMPPPKLNISLMNSLYVAPVSQSEQPIEEIKPRNRTVDPDTISIDTVIFEEICTHENYIPSDTLSVGQRQEVEPMEASLASGRESSELEADNQQENNEIPEPTVETLENVLCSQLSIHEDDLCEDPDHQTQETTREDNQVISANLQQGSQSLRSQQPSQEMPNNYLTKRSSSLDKSSKISQIADIPERKRSKLDAPPENNLSASINSQGTVLSRNPLVQNNSNPKPKEMPHVKNIETITRPINVQINNKPLIADAPPTSPSNLFSPRYYAPSCASSENLSPSYCNSFNEAQSGFPGMAECSSVDLPPNWQNLSPPQSMLSFASSSAPVKNATATDNSVKPATQAENPAPNFFNFFNAPRSNPKAFF